MLLAVCWPLHSYFGKGSLHFMASLALKKCMYVDLKYKPICRRTSTANLLLSSCESLNEHRQFRHPYRLQIAWESLLLRHVHKHQRFRLCFYSKLCNPWWRLASRRASNTFENFLKFKPRSLGAQLCDRLPGYMFHMVQ